MIGVTEKLSHNCILQIKMALPPTYTEGFHTKESIQGINYRQLGKTDLMVTWENSFGSNFNLWKVSSLSFGASSLGGVFKATDDSESAGLVKRVLQQGINYIDTAPWWNNWN